MAGYRIPGSLCVTRSEALDTGTSCLWATPAPGLIGAAFGAAAAPARTARLMSVAGGTSPRLLAFGPDGVTLLKSVEALHLLPYDDQTGKGITAWVAGATIGYGHLIAKGDWATYKAGLTAAQSDALFATDLAPFVEAVSDSITVGLQQYEFDALVILAFNIGVTGFKGSSVVKLVNFPKAVTAYASLEAAWKSWNKSQGKVMKGLDNRRRCEWKIYTMAPYERW